MSSSPDAPPGLHRRWSQVGRYLAAATVGLAAWCAAAAVWLSVPLSAAQEDAVGAALFLDLVLGVLALALLPLRRRRPLAVACVMIIVSAVSAAALGVAAVAVASVASRRRRGEIGAIAAVSLVSAGCAEFLYRPRFTPGPDSVGTAASGVLLGVLFFGAALAVGAYVGTRRELFASLGERVRTADRERLLATAVAREAERTRIAREMHDVLAHRISLVALHAGALVYRDDLTREQTAQTAATIQANAQLALGELRQVLGVLRAGHPGDRVEDPQPSLAELPALLADSREAGATVELDTSGLGRPLADLPETLSRTSFRIVQEALTNARKYARGKPVSVRLAGRPGGTLEVRVLNAAGDRATAVPSAGVGLAGLTERAELAGGQLEHGPRPDGSFVVRAMLPWRP